MKDKTVTDVTEWQPINTAPVSKELLLWWRPINDNKYAESVVIGTVCYGGLDDKWWNSQRGEYQDIWHITHWMLMPSAPQTGE